MHAHGKRLMQATYNFALILAATVALGAGAIQALHAQAKPPAYVGFEIAVKDKDGYNNNLLKDGAEPDCRPRRQVCGRCAVGIERITGLLVLLQHCYQPH